MEYQYVVILRRNNESQVDRISVFLCLLSIAGFTFEQVIFRRFSYFFTFASVALTGGIILNTIVQKKEGKQARYKIWLAIAGISWLQMPWMPWLSILYFLFAFLEYQAKYPLEIGFSKNEVVINALLKRKFNWSAFNNIILKDGLLTLDFRNNKLFQKETIDDDEPEADEDEFNEYCKEQLSNSNLRSDNLGSISS